MQAQRKSPAHKSKNKFSDFPTNWKYLNGVYVNPKDCRSFPHPVTFISPNDFEYFADKNDSIPPPPWGFTDDSSEPAMVTFIKGLLSNSSDYSNYKDHPSPMEQYTRILTQKKEKKISIPPVSTILDRMIVIKITMPYIDKNLLYRIVELPASVSLAVLHDKILSAVMGWCRGYHGYVFQDCYDGSVLGPKENSGYIDMMHAQTHFYAIGDDRKFPLASLINKVGDVCIYVYDLGDRFEHLIELVEIKAAGYSPAKNITIIDGKGACPPEDSNGLEDKSNASYAEFLRKYIVSPNSCTEAIKTIQSSAVNYSMHCFGVPIQFRPLEYDIPLHQFVLDLMIEGPNCIKPRSCLMEVVESYAVCQNCGEALKPLLMCSACHKVKYCSRTCQKRHWKEGHKYECCEAKNYD